MKKYNTSGSQAAPQNTGTKTKLALPHGHVPEGNSASSEALPRPGKAQLEFSYVESSPIPIEALLTKTTLADHYGLSIRTINYCLTLGLPKVQLGARVRFRLSDVQPWFEQNGSRRFAAEGIKLAIQKSLAKQYHFNLSDQVQITVKKPNTKPNR